MQRDFTVVVLKSAARTSFFLRDFFCATLPVSRNLNKSAASFIVSTARNCVVSIGFTNTKMKLAGNQPMMNSDSMTLAFSTTNRTSTQSLSSSTLPGNCFFAAATTHLGFQHKHATVFGPSEVVEQRRANLVQLQWGKLMFNLLMRLKKM